MSWMAEVGDTVESADGFRGVVVFSRWGEALVRPTHVYRPVFDEDGCGWSGDMELGELEPNAVPPAFYDLIDLTVVVSAEAESEAGLFG